VFFRAGRFSHSGIREALIRQAGAERGTILGGGGVAGVGG
jgi:hypothetical protein